MFFTFAAVDPTIVVSAIGVVGAVILALIARPRASALPPPTGDQGRDMGIMRELARENGQLDSRVRALEARLFKAGIDPGEVPS